MTVSATSHGESEFDSESIGAAAPAGRAALARQLNSSEGRRGRRGPGPGPGTRRGPGPGPGALLRCRGTQAAGPGQTGLSEARAARATGPRAAGTTGKC